MVESIISLADSLYEDYDNSDEKLALMGMIWYYSYSNNNFQLSLDYFQKLYDRGHISASYMLGKIYKRNYIRNIDNHISEGTQKDLLAKAMSFFEISVKHGNSNAMVELGHFYDNFEGFETNYQEAKKYYDMAIAKDGNRYACHRLGVLYYNGRGVDKNTKMAKELYVNAMQAGIKDSVNNLWNMLERNEEFDLQEDQWIIASLILKRCETGQASNVVNAKKYLNGIGNYVQVLWNRVQELENIVKYAPESEEYKKAMERFNERQKSLK